jgi:hypothetical protein
MERKKNKRFESMLEPLVASMVNQAGFKYNYETVWALPITLFNHSVTRIQKFHQYCHLMGGIYAGTVKTDDIDKKEMNWMA